jgi:hypothetical protein
VTAAKLLERVRAEGFTLTPGAGGTLVVAPASRLTDELRAELRARKSELLAALAGPRQLAPTPDPGAGLSAASLADWSQRGEVVEIASRSLGGIVYVVPGLEAVASLVGSGVPRHRIFTAAELAELAGLFTLTPPQRAAALRALDVAREILGTIELVAVRPAAKQPGVVGARPRATPEPEWRGEVGSLITLAEQ